MIYDPVLGVIICYSPICFTVKGHNYTKASGVVYLPLGVPIFGLSHILLKKSAEKHGAS